MAWILYLGLDGSSLTICIRTGYEFNVVEDDKLLFASQEAKRIWHGNVVTIIMSFHEFSLNNLWKSCWKIFCEIFLLKLQFSDWTSRESFFSSLEKPYDFHRSSASKSIFFFISDVISFHDFPFGYFPFVFIAILQTFHEHRSWFLRGKEEYPRSVSVLFCFAVCAVVVCAISIAEIIQYTELLYKNKKKKKETNYTIDEKSRV